jgi:putative transposase
MGRSKSEIYLHIVWSTRRRQRLLTEDIERSVYRCIEQQAGALKCDVLAIGGVEDHIHLVVKTPTTVCAATFAKKIKGVSSTFVRDQLDIHEPFRWQEGFAVYSISRSHRHSVIAYVQNQKERHATGKLWNSLEQMEEDADDAE